MYSTETICLIGVSKLNVDEKQQKQHDHNAST